MINLLPLEDKQNLKSEYRARFTIALLGFVCTFLFAGALLLGAAYALLFFKKNTADEQIFILESDDRIGANIALINDINKKISILNITADTQILKSETIRTIIAGRGDIKISQISYQDTNGGVLDISGVSPDRDTLLYFVDYLKKLGFASVDVPISNFVKNKNIEFSVHIIVSE